MKKFYYLLISIGLLLWGNAMYAQFEVGNTNIIFQDPDRGNREIDTQIYYPAQAAGTDTEMANGAFPYAVFGHGFVMEIGAYDNYVQELVPRGYLVVLVNTETSFAPSHQEFGLDLGFVGANLYVGSTQNENSVLYNKVADKSVVMGHSMGGGSSFLASGFDAMITFAPAETNPSSTAAAANFSNPALVIAGGLDCIAPPADHQIPMFNALASTCKSYIEITDGSHCFFANSSFTCELGEGICSPTTLTREEQHATVFSLINPWLDMHLKSDCNAWDDFLTTYDTAIADGIITGEQNCDILVEVETPNIAYNNDGLSTDTEGTAYNWFLNGQPIGLGESSYQPTEIGDYYVVVVLANGCAVQSEIFTLASITNLSNLQEDTSLNVYPNPVQNTVYIELPTSALNANVSLYNIQGKKVWQQTVHHSHLSVNVATLPTGIYYVSLQLNASTIVSNKIVVQ